MKRIAAGAATLAMIASMALAMPMTASAEATKYSGIITGSSAKDSALTGSVTYKDANDADQTFTSYNAAELKKILVIKDDANIPKVSFGYTASAGEAVAATTTTHAVLAGVSPANIKWVEEQTKTVANANDTFDVDNVGEHSAGTAGASFTLKYAAQDVHDDNGGKISGATDTYTMAAGSDNVLLNNTSTAVDGNSTDVYYAIKTMRLDFTDCGFTEPGIYRYVITENNTAQDGVTYDSTLTRTIDVYVEDATYTPYTSGTAGETQNKLRIAGYVMYKGTVTDAPAKPGTESAGTASTLEDGLANTAKGDNGASYGTPNGYEVSGTTKSEGFKNTYVTHELTFSKEVTGNQASKDKFFKFKLEIKNVVKDSSFDVDITNAESAVPDTVNAATQNSYASQINAAQLVADDSKTLAADGYTFTLNPGSDSVGTITAYYYLQHGDKVIIKGLPDNTSYAITESQEDYTAALVITGDTTNGVDATTGTEIDNTLTVDNADADDANWTAGYVDTALKDDADAKFTNTRKGTIPTGVILSIAAPAAVGAAAIGGIAFILIRNKRRKSEEE
ncbi:MAG: hypothetical protein ILA24_06685 [Ruminococcus sp.]|nr:hypothetical protein [Ruminococcus sp.]